MDYKRAKDLKPLDLDELRDYCCGHEYYISFPRHPEIPMAEGCVSIKQKRVLVRHYTREPITEEVYDFKDYKKTWIAYNAKDVESCLEYLENGTVYAPLADWAQLVEDLENHIKKCVSFKMPDCDRLKKRSIDMLKSLISEVESAESRAEKAERERDYAIKQLKIAADENGGCWGCKWFDDMTEKCTNPEGMVSCSTVTNNMWEWRGLKEE